MTAPRKISFYVADDLVSLLEGVEDVSAYIVESIRMRRRNATRAMLWNAGYFVNDAGVQRMRERLRALESQNTDDDYAREP
jgi:hypothetical protein